MMNEPLTIKIASEQDLSTICFFVKKIAEYENLSFQVETTEALLYQAIFIEKGAHVLLAMIGEEAVGFAIYYYNFSSFKAKRGLYLEDIFVLEEYRKQGVGKALFNYLLEKTKTEKLGRMEFSCLNWNQKAIDFYLALGAKPLDEWTVFRIDDL